MIPYSPPAVLFNRHLETIYPSLLRKVDFIPPECERIETPDDDFLDLDWYRQNSKKCVIVSHGLEGSSRRTYIRGMARAFFQRGFDVLAWSYRGCSGEVNRQLRFYHSGATDDLHTVVLHARERYETIFLIGFSLGGNLTLKYLGEGQVPQEVKKSTVFSVPLNLHTSCLELLRPYNWIYTRRFLKSLTLKVRAKASLLKEFNLEKLNSITSLIEFDDYFTGPIHGFHDAIDYYTQCSSINFIPKITVPTLVVNAQNDPFLSPDCFPRFSEQNPLISFEFPDRGGHVGFARFDGNGLYWSESRALSFLEAP